jgi:hypothetical protein
MVKHLNRAILPFRAANLESGGSPFTAHDYHARGSVLPPAPAISLVKANSTDDLKQPRRALCEIQIFLLRPDLNGPFAHLHRQKY